MNNGNNLIIDLYSAYGPLFASKLKRKGYAYTIFTCIKPKRYDLF